MDPNYTSISTWTKLHVAPSAQFDAQRLVEPLEPVKLSINRCVFGCIDEYPEHYLLIIAWSSAKALDSFRVSLASHKMQDVIKSFSSQPPTEFVIDFGPYIWWPPLGPNTELRIIYFPKSISQEIYEAVREVKQMRSLMAHRTDNSDAIFRSHAINGWLNGARMWNGEETLACLWAHFWASKEREENFKKTGKRMRPDDSWESVLEGFDRDLKSLGALGWDEYHVSFVDWWKALGEKEEEGEEKEEGMIDDDSNESRRNLSEASLS